MRRSDVALRGLARADKHFRTGEARSATFRYACCRTATTTRLHRPLQIVPGNGYTRRPFASDKPRYRPRTVPA